MCQNYICSSMQTCTGGMQSITKNLPLQQVKGKFVVVKYDRKSGPGRSASVQIYSSTVVDQSTGKGKLSEKAYLKPGKSKKDNSSTTTIYEIELHVEPEFGTPGAFLIRNQHKHKFFLEYATLEVSGKQTVFDCRSWVYPVEKTKSERIFFSNTSYLPKETPSALVELRKSELISLRGDGTGERKEWDRIYDYDYYNDLGCPDKGEQHARPVLGGSKSHPYPRRGRTGRPPTVADPLTERRLERNKFDIYVPPDERFSPTKLSEFIRNSIQATVHLLIPEAKALLEENAQGFESFDHIKDLFSAKRKQELDEKVKEKLQKLLPDAIFKEVVHASKECTTEIPIPDVIAEDEFAWMNDEEFGRQMLAGTNPVQIKCLSEFPPESKYVVSAIRKRAIEQNLDGLTLYQAMQQWRIFILDHHDYLMPFLNRINYEVSCTYASRTLFFLRDDATLKPVAIELNLPSHRERSRVFYPASEGTEAALWHFAKAHVAANDSAYHQLISHWLHTHAVVEPFIIATRRQLSIMHPIHRLLDPHFKDTMHINALARSFLINSDGILEKTLSTGPISMELSSKLYKAWRFDEQALPADLLKRGLALDDRDNPDNPIGVELLFEDYPYGADGLDIWQAIKTWVTEFCLVFYKDDDSVISDVELREWWSEIRNVGHGDKRNKTWWYQMTTLSDLIQALTTLIWITSGLHASLNFGQYAYAGYPPNRPIHCQRQIPKEGRYRFALFLNDPDKFYLDMLPQRFLVNLGIALTKVLSEHTSEEQYLGQRPSEWTDNEEVKEKFKKFNVSLREIEKRIGERNRNLEFKNRWGPAKIPYELLHPDTSNIGPRGGITGKGIPNSISI